MKSNKAKQNGKTAMNYGSKTTPVRGAASYNTGTTCKKPGNNFSGKVGKTKLSGKTGC